MTAQDLIDCWVRFGLVDSQLTEVGEIDRFHVEVSELVRHAADVAVELFRLA